MSGTNELCTDVGYRSINHYGEQLCGDHVEVVRQDENTTVVVLADGLGSGVKASILSTLTSTIISTMAAANMRLEDTVATIAATLPVCAERGVAYSTFTILRIVNNRRAEIIQYDNPKLVLLRDGKAAEYDTLTRQLAGKEILQSEFPIRENDLFVMFSDGVEHAGVGKIYNFGWKRSDIIRYMESYWDTECTAKTMSAYVLDETERLYDGQPGDDATVCAVRIRPRVPMNLMVGPPASRNDEGRMMALFFSKEGKHIVCGGTTSTVVSRYLKKPLKPSLNFPDPEIPPIAELEGVDLVTEGVITINRVVEYAKDYLGENRLYEDWSLKMDGASQIARMLFQEATDITFFVGKAVNPAHQNPDLPINFNIKMRLVEEMSDCLEKMGKRIKVSTF